MKAISEKAMNSDYGILINVSRSIIFAGEKEDFAAEAKAMAAQYQNEMSR